MYQVENARLMINIMYVDVTLTPSLSVSTGDTLYDAVWYPFMSSHGNVIVGCLFKIYLLILYA